MDHISLLWPYSNCSGGMVLVNDIWGMIPEADMLDASPGGPDALRLGAGGTRGLRKKLALESMISLSRSAVSCESQLM